MNKSIKKKNEQIYFMTNKQMKKTRKGVIMDNKLMNFKKKRDNKLIII